MTVSTIYAPIEYAGDASTVAFPVPWMFLEANDLRITKIDDATDAETAVVTFTVSGTGEPTGGTVALPAALGTGYTLRIERRTDRTQEMDLQPQGRFPAETVERSVDKLTLIVQELEESIGTGGTGSGTAIETIVTDDPSKVEITKTGTEVKINVLATNPTGPAGGDLAGTYPDPILKQGTGVGSLLLEVETDFSWAGWAGGSTLGGRGIAAGYAWFGDPGSQVHLPVWGASDAYAIIRWTRDYWVTTVQDSSLSGIIGPGVLNVKPPCMAYVEIAGVWCWVLTSDSDGTWWYAQDIAANYNSNGSLKVAAWVAGTPATRVMADIATDTETGVSCMVGNHGYITRTDDWTTWTDVHNTGGPVIGGIATDNDGTWIAVTVTGTLLRSLDGGLTWSSPTIYERAGESGAYASAVSLIPAGNVIHGNGIWLVTGVSSYAYSTDGVYWTVENSALGTFYGVGFDGVRYFATNPNNGTNPAIIYQLLVSSIPFHRQVVAERGLVVGGDTYLKDLPSAGSLETDQNGKVIDGGAKVLLADLTNSSDPSKGAGIPGYKGRTVRDRLGDTVSLRDFSGDAVGDNWTTALQNALTAAGEDGRVVIPGNGYEYEISANIALNGQVVEGIGWPVLRWTGTSQSVDFFALNGGSVEDSQSGTETIGSILRGVSLQIGASGELRDFVRVNYGDHTKIEDCKLSAGLRPCRDGIHIEPVCTPGSPKTWYIENVKIENVRISRAGRDGIQIKIPAKGIYENECFVNLGTILQCEVRGTGKNATHRNTADGVAAIRFLNDCDVAATTHKISQWEIIGGEYQTSPYATGTADAPTFGIRCQHVDNTKGGDTEYITVVGGTYEKIEAGSMYTGSIGMDFLDTIRCTLVNPGVYGWAYTRDLSNMYRGNPSIIGTDSGMAYDAMRFGTQFMRRGVWTPAVEGESTAGTWTPAFALGSYFRIGHLVFVQFQLSGTLGGGAAGNLRIKNLPFTLHNDPSGANAGAFSAGGVVEVMEGVTLPANFTQVVLRGVADSKNLNVWRHGSAQNSTRVQVSEVTGTLKLYGSLVYEARRFEDEDGTTYPKILWNS